MGSTLTSACQQRMLVHRVVCWRFTRRYHSVASMSLHWVRINASSVLASPVTSSHIEANRSQTAVASAVPLVVDSPRTDRKNTWKARPLNVMQELASVLLVFQQGQGERHGFNNGEGSKWRQHVHPVPCCPQPFFQGLHGKQRSLIALRQIRERMYSAHRSQTPNKSS